MHNNRIWQFDLLMKNNTRIHYIYNGDLGSLVSNFMDNDEHARIHCNVGVGKSKRIDAVVLELKCAVPMKKQQENLYRKLLVGA